MVKITKSNIISWKKVMIVAVAITTIGGASATLSSWGIRPVISMEMTALASDVGLDIEELTEEVGSVQIQVYDVQRQAALQQLWQAEREVRRYERQEEEPPASVEREVAELNQRIEDLNIKISTNIAE